MLNGGWLVSIVSGLLFWRVGGLAEGLHETVVVGSYYNWTKEPENPVTFSRS